jgi:hypothetical protein
VHYLGWALNEVGVRCSESILSGVVPKYVSYKEPADEALLPLDNTWTGVNTFESILVSSSTSADLTDETQKAEGRIRNESTTTISGGDEVFGKYGPALIEDKGVYEIEDGGVYGVGAFAHVHPTVKLTTLPAFSGIAGPWSVILSESSFENHVNGSDVSWTNYHIDLHHTVKNSGDGALVVGDFGVNFRPIYGPGVSIGNSVGFISGTFELDATATIENLVGFDCQAKVAGTACNIGYSYGNPTKPDDGRYYAWNSQGSGHMVATGGGVVNRTFTIGDSNFVLTSALHHIFLEGIGTAVLPLNNSVPVGLVFKIYNISGGTLTILPQNNNNNTLVGVSATVANNTSRTVINEGTKWVFGY